MKLYVLGQFALVNLATVAFLYASPRLPLPLTLGAIGIALTLLSLGGLLDRRLGPPAGGRPDRGGRARPGRLLVL